MAETWTYVELTDGAWTPLTSGAADVVIQMATSQAVAIKTADTEPEIGDMAFLVLEYPHMPGLPRSFEKALWARSLLAAENAVRVLAQ
ncbi:hypothetical protein [Amorphus sp. 3PC139-8]|uniref:hypothetical protein n=1 Tax=Amorphus sp. 3PC139-8 TaxID=2735676 RepID=UPI00345CE303